MSHGSVLQNPLTAALQVLGAFAVRYDPYADRILVEDPLPNITRSL